MVVVEASEKSGSLITARYAVEQGRDVMAVPGSVLSGRNRGSHSLLKDGAKIVETADDILDELGWHIAGDSHADAAARTTRCSRGWRRGSATGSTSLIAATGAARFTAAHAPDGARTAGAA